jgi:hypothetical protein
VARDKDSVFRDHKGGIEVYQNINPQKTDKNRHSSVVLMLYLPKLVELHLDFEAELYTAVLLLDTGFNLPERERSTSSTHSCQSNVIG